VNVPVSAIITRKEFKPIERLILAYFSLHVDSNNEIDISYPILADELGITKNTAMKFISSLADKRAIFIFERICKKSKGRLENRYLLNVDYFIRGKNLEH